MREVIYSQSKNNWTVRLPEFSAEEGLLDAMLHRYEDALESARANGEQHLLLMEEFASCFAKMDHTEEATKIFKFIQDVSHEISNGAALFMPRVVCVGRKAECRSQE